MVLHRDYFRVVKELFPVKKLLLLLRKLKKLMKIKEVITIGIVKH
jgi:hypothetical protein